MIKNLAKLANHLDKKGLTKEADYLDKLIKNAITEGWISYDTAPQTGKLINEAPDDAAKKITNVFMGTTPIAGTFIDILSIIKDLNDLNEELNKTKANPNVVKSIYKNLMTNGGLLVISAIPLSEIGKIAGKIGVAENTLNLIKSSPISESTTAASLNDWHWDRMLDVSGLTKEYYQSVQPELKNEVPELNKEELQTLNSVIDKAKKHE